MGVRRVHLSSGEHNRIWAIDRKPLMVYSLRCILRYRNVAGLMIAKYTGCPIPPQHQALYRTSMKDAANSPTRFGPTALDSPNPYNATIVPSSPDTEDLTSFTESFRSAMNVSTTEMVKVYNAILKKDGGRWVREGVSP